MVVAFLVALIAMPSGKAPDLEDELVGRLPAVASFTLVRQVSAPPEVVFDVLPITGATPSDPAAGLGAGAGRRAGAERVGAIRVFGSVGPALREEVIGYEPPSRYSYTLLSGLPLRTASAPSLEPAGAGTEVI